MKKEIIELFELDREFCDYAKKTKKWDKFLSSDIKMGTRLHEPYIVGKKKISKLIEMIYSLDNIDFTWEPKEGYVSDDMTLGFTSGIYTRKYQINNREEVEIGKYITVWKKENNTWKIVFDMGN